eukprot:TRINITY_DN25885_c0_g1_i2.p1 TRINITY_DN25885_c0_g1~~TRINITY_DN25885_c0_g1_i2.p1  ORF type:complete len:262 (-),score=44.16 TRINITY_DN25885_c0_g1_i2:32-787(-)
MELLPMPDASSTCGRNITGSWKSAQATQHDLDAAVEFEDQKDERSSPASRNMLTEDIRDSLLKGEVYIVIDQFLRWLKWKVGKGYTANKVPLDGTETTFVPRTLPTGGIARSKCTARSYEEVRWMHMLPDGAEALFRVNYNSADDTLQLSMAKAGAALGPWTLERVSSAAPDYRENRVIGQDKQLRKLMKPPSPGRRGRHPTPVPEDRAVVHRTLRKGKGEDAKRGSCWCCWCRHCSDESSGESESSSASD